MQNKKLLFIAYGGGHIKMLIPLILKAKNHSNFDVTVVGLTTAGEALKAFDIPFLSYKNLVYLEHRNDWQRYGKLLVGEESGSSLVPYKESIAYHGINYCELIDFYGLEEAKLAYQRLGRQSFYPIEFMKRVLIELAPDLVVSTNSPRSERAAIQASSELGIKSICIVDMFAMQEVAWISQSGFATKVCVLNESVREMFIENGRHPDDIVVTGNPAFDNINSSAVLHAAKFVRESHQVAECAKIVLYASQPEPENHPFCNLRGDPNLPVRIEESLRLFIKDNHNFHLIVRLHPSENRDFVQQNRVSFSSKTEPLHPLIHASDIVVVAASTVGLEAHLAGKPVLSIDLSIFQADAPFSRMGISSGIRDLSLLPHRICTLIQNANPQPIHNTSASDNVFKLIVELANSTN